ncbi:MAG: prepilin peptidase [Gammaproteobacteria bacterium]
MSQIADLPIAVLAFVAGLFGLVTGSFLNVVIHRLPIMMERGWKRECRELLEADAPPTEKAEATEERYDLMMPGSTCPHCGHRIRAWENIPLLSWLVLRARCSACGAGISIRYPLIELASGGGAALMVWQWGFTGTALAYTVMTWILIALSGIDIDHQLLPDSLTLPLLWLGMAVAGLGLTVPLEDALWGAIAGYLSLWSLFHAFRLLTGKEGMGAGDFKLLAALGAWLGWSQLPLVALMASAVGAIGGGLLMATGLLARDSRIPFGPFLAAGGWVSMMWGERIIAAYLGFVGLPS